MMALSMSNNKLSIGIFHNAMPTKTLRIMLTETGFVKSVF